MQPSNPQAYLTAVRSKFSDAQALAEKIKVFCPDIVVCIDPAYIVYGQVSPNGFQDPVTGEWILPVDPNTAGDVVNYFAVFGHVMSSDTAINPERPWNQYPGTNYTLAAQNVAEQLAEKGVLNGGNNGGMMTGDNIVCIPMTSNMVELYWVKNPYNEKQAN